MNREMLKECIADAKTIKETAIASAKVALEEAFTPTLMASFAEQLNELELEESEAEKELEENYDEVESELEETFNLEELLAELEESDDSSIEEEGMYEEQLDEELMLEEMSELEIEKIVTQVLNDMIASGKLMPGEGEEEDMEDMGDMEDMDDIEDMEDMDDMDGETDKEEINIDELLAELEGEEIEPTSKQMENEVTNQEMEDTINELRNELNEVNLLNAKLLYTNKIFKSKNLTESEKIKVLNTFDKAESVKEVKLVYETLTESLKVTTTTKKNPIKESLGSASKTISTATPKQPIIEVNNAFMRMQQLAGLRK